VEVCASVHYVDYADHYTLFEYSHRIHRSITRPFFSRERISDFQIFDRHAQSALTLLHSRLREGHPVDFQDLVSRFTLDSATEYLFGSNVESLSAGLPYTASAQISPAVAAEFASHPANAFAVVFAYVQRYALMVRGCYGAWWPLAEIFNYDMDRNMRVIHAFVDPLVKQAIERVPKTENEAGAGARRGKVEESDTLLDYLVRISKGALLYSTSNMTIDIV
jgi:hypothetical protein